MTDQDDPISFSVPDAVDRLGVSRRTVYHMIEDGRLTIVADTPGHMRITRESLVVMRRHLKGSVTVTGAAKHLGVCRRTAYNRIEACKLITTSNGRGNRRVTLQSLKECAAPPEPDAGSS